MRWWLLPQRSSNRLLKKGCRASRDYPAASPSRRRGVSRSLFVATPPLVLALLDEEDYLLERGASYYGPGSRETRAEHYLTGQVAVAYEVGNGFKPFPTEDSRAPVSGILLTQLASACLRVVPPRGTKTGAFLSILIRKFLENRLTFPEGSYGFLDEKK